MRIKGESANITAFISMFKKKVPPHTKMNIDIIKFCGIFEIFLIIITENMIKPINKKSNNSIITIFPRP